MLRIISKTAQLSITAISTGVGDLSLAPGSPTDAYGKPVELLRRIVRERGQARGQRAWDRSMQHYQKLRNPANGTCPACGQGMALDERTNRPFCPGCPVARPVPRAPTIRPPIR